MSEGGASGAPSAGGGGMSVADENICKAALEVLMSQTNGKKNYLFLEPVDLKFVPNYPDVVKRPMDLGTIKKNLDGAEGATKTFQSREEFWADVDLVFENAIFFHTPIKENAWIIKLAKQMQKVVEREKKKAEKKAVGGGAGAGIVSGATQKKKRGRPPSRSGADAGGDPPKPAVKLKLSVPKAAAAAPTAAAAAPQQVGAFGGDSSATTTAAKAKPSKPKLKLKLGGSTTGSIGSSSRGKEVPSDVDKAKPAAKVSKPKLKLSISESSGPPPTGKSNAGKGRGPGGGKKIPPPAKGSTMSPAEVAQCSKVLSAIHNRNTQEDIQWFLKPVSDPQLVEDYKSKIRYPSDLGTIATKLDKNQYNNVAEFVLDVRRIFANCLRYNTSVNDSFRPLAKKLAKQTEGILALFLAAPAAPKRVYPRLLYCWKLCLSLLDTLFNMTNPTDGHQTAYFFMHPVSFYLGGALPQDYLAKVQTPMDFGTITSRLFEGEYQDVLEFIEDCRLVVDNCRTYYAGREEGKLFIELADRMDGLMAQQLNALKRYDESAAGKREKEAAVTPLAIPVPSATFLMSVMKEIRDMQYTDKFTKITEPATTIFNLPVIVAMFPDYPNYVSQPMDLSTVESKIGSGAYATPEDFEYDINLIFQNCEAYNGSKKNAPLVSLAKFCAKTFKRIYAKKMDDLRAGIGVDIPGKRSASSPEAQPASKRIKLDLSAVPKAAPRISITASKVADATARSTSPKPQGTSPPKKLDEPVPLHVAIAQIKESFPLRRPAKMLGGWEAVCWRMFRELMKHPWLSAARPKFIYSVPVPVLFPSLRDAYAELIKQPMDLTTAEAKLLSGGMYLSAQEFVKDVALVFANAIIFNRDGHEEGDPTSCAYFDASKHLLRYTRWLSLEYLSEFLANDEHVDIPSGKDELVTAWKLTTGNRKVAREEMENIALKTPMDLSEEGERYTLMESESDKLLKSLRHQSDARYMYFFIQPVYPPDYSAFISKPMAWDVCNETLQNRQYENIGELVDDLRLIFSNALKYNGGGKGTETISGKAYDSAVYMSTKKLEPAIDRMLISVSNRIETDKVEQVMQEREIEADERAEEERLRKAWQEETENAKAQGTAPQTETTTVEKIRIIQRRPVRKALDFDFPFNDDDDDNQEPSHLDTMRQQKMIFESQRSDRRKMFTTSMSSSSDVYFRMLQQRKAIAWARMKAAATAASVKEAKAASGETLDDAAAGESKDSIKKADSSHISSSNVGDKANKEREQINEKLKTALGTLKQKKTRKKKKSKASINVFD